MARVSVEQKALTDPRFYRLGVELGAQPEHAQAVGLFMMVRVWNECTERGRYTLDGWLLQSILGKSDGALIIERADLVVALKNNRYRVRGTKGRIEYLEACRRIGRANGYLGAEHGKKGGRPKNPPTGVPETPHGGGENNPLLTLTLTPAPVPKTRKKRKTKDSAATPLSHQVRERNPLFDAIAEVTGFDPATAGSVIGKVTATLKKSSPEYTPDEVREFGRRYWEFCPHAADSSKTRPTPTELEKFIGLVRAQAVERSGPIRGQAGARTEYASRTLGGIL